MRLDALAPLVRSSVHAREAELLEIRRDLHAHPELSWSEARTTALIADRLRAAGLEPRVLEPTGLTLDLGAVTPDLRIGLRADLDALPIAERSGLPYASGNDGVSHACGHDVHTTALLGACLALAEHEEELRAAGVGVRAIFQPAEESVPSGAPAMTELGLLDGVDAVYALHVDPRRDVGEVGIRSGAITAASDEVVVDVRGNGGHTSRPHLTQDVTYALAKIITDLPAVLTRRLDPRNPFALVWGSVHSGSAPNVIPDSGQARGTLRMLDEMSWQEVSSLLTGLAETIARPYEVQVELTYRRSVPAVINTVLGAETVRTATLAILGPAGVQDAEQSMGGEDFAWMLAGRQGALARLGTRTPGGPTYDLHQGDLVIDERAIAVGAQLLAAIPFAAVPDMDGVEIVGTQTSLTVLGTASGTAVDTVDLEASTQRVLR